MTTTPSAEQTELPPLPTSQAYVKVWYSTKAAEESLQSPNDQYYTASQMVEYAKEAARAPLLARIEQLEKENERLTKCLKDANAGMEEYERKFYLKSHDCEALEAQVATARDDAAFEIVKALVKQCDDNPPAGESLYFVQQARELIAKREAP